MRIAYVVAEFPFLSQTFVLNQVTGLLDLGHDVHVHVQFRGEITGAALAGYDFGRRIHPWGMPWSWYLRYNRLPRVLRQTPQDQRHLLLRAMDPLRYGLRALDLELVYASRTFLNRSYDVIHCHFGPNGERMAVMKELGIVKAPLVTTFHGFGVRLAKEKGAQMYDALRSQGDLFIAISKYSRHRLEELGFDPARIAQHAMGIDLARFPLRPTQDPAEPLRGEPVRILSVGRLVPEKGYDVGLQALKRVLEEDPTRTIQYTIVGDGPQRSEIEHLAERLGLRRHVQFTGPLKHDEVAAKMSQADIFLLPSRAEVLPVVLMEAQATGLPVVATDVGAVTELVEDGASGYVVPPEDSGALAGALGQLLRSTPQQLQAMGRHGRTRVVERHNIPKLNKELEHLLRSVAERGPGRASSAP